MEAIVSSLGMRGDKRKSVIQNKEKNGNKRREKENKYKYRHA